MVEHSRRGMPGRRGVLFAATAVTVGTALIGLAGAANAAPQPAAAKCTVDFTSSNDSPAVGQDITLRWITSGADKLLASWTSAAVPFSGTQVTTRSTVGPVSYQVTGLKDGQYCGGAAVNVVFTAAASSAATSPSPVVTSSAAPSTSSVVAPTSSVAPPSTSAVTYPAQSPTGGTPTPWYERPVNLLVLGVLSLLGSIALFNRERVRAVVVRRH